MYLPFKVRYPQRIFLLRGSHETRCASSLYGLRDDCTRYYPDSNAYDLMCSVFDCMPLAACVDGKVHNAPLSLSLSLSLSLFSFFLFLSLSLSFSLSLYFFLSLSLSLSLFLSLSLSLLFLSHPSISTFETPPFFASLTFCLPQKIYCVHSGLSPSCATLKDLESIDRYTSPLGYKANLYPLSLAQIS